MRHQQELNTLPRTGDGAPANGQKVVTVILDDSQEAIVDFVEEHFKDFNKEEVTQIVSGLLHTAAVEMLDKSDFLQRTSPDAWVTLNNGSLYDSIQFETSVYTTDSSNGVRVNTTFGAQCDQDTKQYVGYRNAGNVLLQIASELHPLQVD